MAELNGAQLTGRDLLCIRGDRIVFRGLDFDLAPGDALILVGPNGSGKSSLLRLLARLLKPAGGVLAWDGEPIADDPESHRGRIHYVGHHDAVKPVLSVEENLAFWAGLRGDAAEAEIRLAKALDIFDINHLRAVPGRMLSAGQKRRVNLARIVASYAPVWLLDEPTTALDKASIKKLEAGIEDHRAEGGMVVLSTHSDVGLKNTQVLDLADFAVLQDPHAHEELEL